MQDADIRASDLPAGTDTPPRHTAIARRPLPAGISEQLSDEAPRLLDELHMRDDTLAQQAQLVRQLQTALQRAQSTNQELALIADRVSDAILICDMQRCITWVNPAFTRLTGFTLTECHGQQPEELLSGPHTDSATITHINQALALGGRGEPAPLPSPPPACLAGRAANGRPAESANARPPPAEAPETTP